MGRGEKAIWRAIQRIYPREFRRRYGEEMEVSFHRLRAAAGRRGPGAVVRLWLRTVGDTARSGVRERLNLRGYRLGRAGVRVPGRGTAAWLADLAHDLRFAVRTLARSPAYAGVALLTLALGIGANTAVFSVIHGTLLQPLPYAESDELLYLSQGIETTPLRFSVPDIEEIRTRTRALEDVVEHHSMSFTLLGLGEPEEVSTGVVSARFFDVMGVEPWLGRTFVDTDDDDGAEPVLVLSHGYWRQRFGGDPGVVGRAFEMNGRMHTVVGVLPPVPQYPSDHDVYMPTSACPIRSGPGFAENRAARMMSVFARIDGGTTPEAAGRELAAVARTLQGEHPAAYPGERGHYLAASPLEEELVREARPTLLVLLGVAGFVLLIACANVANLALARVTTRQQELAVRTSLGAGRGRLVRQLLTESTVLAVAGGTLGLGVAWASHGLLVGFAARFTPRAFEAGLDVPVLLFALGISVATGLVFGGLPATAVGREVAATLRQGSGLSAGRGRGRIRQVLVMLQLAVSFVVLLGAGLFLRSFLELQRVDAGFDTENTVAMEITVNPRNSDMTMEEAHRFYLRVVEEVERLPGVVAAAVTNNVPLGTSPFDSGVRTEALAGTPVDQLPPAEPRAASEGYLEATGIRLVAGRGFEAADDGTAMAVALVNEGLARKLWPGESPVGQRLQTCSYMQGACDEGWLTVVGVVGDVRVHGLDRPPPDQILRPSRQAAFPGGDLVVRTAADPLARVGEIKAVVHGLAADIPVHSVTTLEDLWGDALAPRRLVTLLLGMFAAVALGVTLAGISGVMAFTVSQRTREIGIRMALGSERSQVVSLVLRQGLALVAAGLVLGALAAVLLVRSVSGLLWGVEAGDPLTFGAVALLLGLVAALACFLPARRASAVDPLEAFRGG